jgi:hypothetical protein
MQCASMVLLHNSALVHFKTKHYDSARALVSFALQILASEIDDQPLVSAKFYEDHQNAALAMSLHFLMANVLLKEGHCSLVHDRSISNVKTFKAAVLECNEAINLAEKYLKVNARNGLLVTQVLSFLGYCMMSISDASQDIKVALSLYQTATPLYNGYRGQAGTIAVTVTVAAPLSEMDKTINNSLPQADVTSDEVAACACAA